LKKILTVSYVFNIRDINILHLSCLGFDKQSHETDGFGPWYGFKQCDLQQYIKDITYSKNFFQEKCKLLTTSHSYLIKSKDLTPFTYMLGKIKENHQKIKINLENLNNKSLFLDNKEVIIKRLLEKDIFFPKKNMKAFLKKIYSLWEYWIIRHHLDVMVNHNGEFISF
jgi:hypothetical protein